MHSFFLAVCIFFVCVRKEDRCSFRIAEVVVIMFTVVRMVMNVPMIMTMRKKAGKSVLYGPFFTAGMDMHLAACDTAFFRREAFNAYIQDASGR